MKHTSLLNYFVPRIRDMIFLIIFSAAMAVGWRTLNTDSDLPRHLRMGQFIVETRSIPQTEMFSYALEDHPYVAHEWLAGVIYYFFYKLLGLKGVVFLTATLISGAFFILYTALSREHDEKLLTGFFILWGAANTSLHWIARPYLFTMLFLAIWLVLIDAVARGRKMYFWLPPILMVVWGNMHAEFVAGFLVLIAYMAGWCWDFLFDRENANPKILYNLAGISVLSFAASLLNPFGLRTWTTILSYLGNDYLMSTINETRPPDFTDPLFLIEFSLIIASILIFALKKGAQQSGQAFLLAGFTALAMTSGRNIHLYGIVAPFVLAGPAIAATDSALQRKVTAAVAHIEGKLKGLVWPVLIMLACWSALIMGKIGDRYFIDPELFPVQAVDWLEANPQSGRMFNDFNWGGYIVWRLWPEQKDFIDSQSDLTGEVSRLYLNAQKLTPGWEQVFVQYNIEWVLMPVDSILSQELARSGWKIIYQDTTAVILRKE